MKQGEATQAAEVVAKALTGLGLNNAHTNMGALEVVAKEIVNSSMAAQESIEGVVNALDRVVDVLDRVNNNLDRIAHAVEATAGFDPS